jgi:hypothetical protein
MSLTISHARDVAASGSKVRMDDFADMRRTGQGFIKVGHAKYRITIANGRATVTADNANAKFRAHFGNRREKLEGALNLRLLRMQTYDALKQTKDGVIRAGFQGIEVKSTRTMLGPGISKGLTGAAYGFESGRPIRNRMVNLLGQETHARLLTIDTQNTNIGVKYKFNSSRPDEGLANMRTLLNRQAIAAMPIEGGISADAANLAQEWKTFLLGKIDDGTAKLDLFDKLGKMREYTRTGIAGGMSPMQIARLKANGLDGEISDALMKNSGLLFKTPYHQPRPAAEQKQLLAKAVALFKELQTLPTPAARIDRLAELLGDQPYPTEALIVEQACVTHYFRQTSKLGLEFFTQQKGMDVNFWLQNPDRSTVSSADTLLGGAREQRHAAGYSEPITFSEMRHAMRLREGGHGAHLKFVTSAPPD